MHSTHSHVIMRLDSEGLVNPIRIRKMSGEEAIKVNINANKAIANEPTFFVLCLIGYTIKHIGTSITAPTRAAAKLISDIMPMPIVAAPSVAAFTAIQSVPTYCIPKKLFAYSEIMTSIGILMMKNATQIPALRFGYSTT